MPNFLDLPAELRNEIYHHAIIKDSPYIIDQPNRPITNNAPGVYREFAFAQHPLTRTNRRIRHE